MYIYIILYIFMCACTQSYYFSNEKQEFYFFIYNGVFLLYYERNVSSLFDKKRYVLNKTAGRPRI